MNYFDVRKRKRNVNYIPLALFRLHEIIRNITASFKKNSPNTPIFNYSKFQIKCNKTVQFDIST